MSDIQTLKEQTLISRKSAWLITWEWTGDHAKVEDKVIAILDSRFSYKNIQLFAEWTYTGSKFAFYEQIAIAKNRKYNPYKVEYGRIEIFEGEEKGLPSSIEGLGKFILGGNPYIYARIIYGVLAFVDDDGKEHLRWKEEINPIIKGGKTESIWQEYEVIR